MFYPSQRNVFLFIIYSSPDISAIDHIPPFAFLMRTWTHIHSLINQATDEIHLLEPNNELIPHRTRQQRLWQQRGAIFVSELVIRFVVHAKREATIGYDRRALCSDIPGLFCARAASDRVAWLKKKQKKNPRRNPGKFQNKKMINFNNNFQNETESRCWSRS